MNPHSKSRLLAASDKGLLTTVLAAVVIVAAFATAMKLYLGAGTWWHDFLFKRTLVQWVLLSAFAIGLVHLAWRVPAWLRERQALRMFDGETSALTYDTLVGRRWLQIESAQKEHENNNLGQYVRSLAEHDEAELDGAYRVSGDVVQVLPLIGFFGTVFGLSHGLYQSFLATGGTTTKDFAKAIAIAFDNTLLGLGLTIILFVLQSVLRKREEATLLQLNLQARDAVASAVQVPVKDPLQVAIENLGGAMKDQEKSINDLGEELSKSRKALESPAEGIKELVRVHTTEAAKAVIVGIAEMQKAQNDEIASALLTRLEEQANKLLTIVSDRTMALTKLAEPLHVDLAGIKATLTVLTGAAQSVTDQVATIARDTPRPQLEDLSAAVKSMVSAMAQRDSQVLDRMQAIEDAKARLTDLSVTAQSIAEQVAALANRTDRPQLEEVSTAIKSLVAAMLQRDTMILERLQALEETKTKLDAVAIEAHSTAQAVAGFGTRLDAVPKERQTVVDVAASIKELAVVIAQRDSRTLETLQHSLDAHAHELGRQIQKPRTIRFIESEELTD